MSLLLEALKKAEDDMRRRRPGGMSLQQDLPPAEPAVIAIPDAGPALPPQAEPLAVPEPPPAVMDPFPELSLSAMEPAPEPVAPAEMSRLPTEASRRPYRVTEDWAMAAPVVARTARAIRLFFMWLLQWVARDLRSL